MMSTFVNNKFLNYHLKGVNAGSPASTIYASIHSAKPNGAGSNEVTSTYFSGRASYTASDFTAPATIGNNRQIASNASLSFGAAISAGVDLPYIGFWDASTSGNFLFACPVLDADGIEILLSFGNGDTVSRPSGSIILALDLNYWSIYARDLQLSWLKGNSIASANANNYLGLATAIASDGTVTEITSTVASGRLAIPSSGWSSISTVSDRQQISNTNNADFDNAISAATGFSAIGLWDASTSGNLIAFSSASLRDIAIGDELLIPATKLKVSLG